jgi:hypothetical protein
MIALTNGGIRCIIHFQKTFFGEQQRALHNQKDGLKEIGKEKIFGNMRKNNTTIAFSTVLRQNKRQDFMKIIKKIFKRWRIYHLIRFEHPFHGHD